MLWRNSDDDWANHCSQRTKKGVPIEDMYSCLSSFKITVIAGSVSHFKRRLVRKIPKLNEKEKKANKKKCDDVMLLDRKKIKINNKKKRQDIRGGRTPAQIQEEKKKRKKSYLDGHSSTAKKEFKVEALFMKIILKL